jgi:hypothetical protein
MAIQTGWVVGAALNCCHENLVSARNGDCGCSPPRGDRLRPFRTVGRYEIACNVGRIGDSARPGETGGTEIQYQLQCRVLQPSHSHGWASGVGFQVAAVLLPFHLDDGEYPHFLQQSGSLRGADGACESVVDGSKSGCC